MPKKQQSEFQRWRKRLTLAENRERGRTAEDFYKIGRSAEGYDVTRSPKGKDFVERRIDPWTGKKGKAIKVEIKTGRAKLSKLQKKTMKTAKKRYKVVRYGLI